MQRRLRIFGRSTLVRTEDSPLGHRLFEELSFYPPASDEPSLVLDVRSGVMALPPYSLNNPRTHFELEDGFAMRFDTTTVRLRFDQSRLAQIDCTISPPRTAWQRGLQRWRSVQFTAVDESPGQTLHELALVPALFLEPTVILLHASAMRLPEGGALLIGGTGGVGKTSLSLELGRQHGCDFLADDITPVSVEREAWPNLAYPKIYAYNVEGNPALARRIMSGRGVLDHLQWQRRRRLGGAQVRRRVPPGMDGGYARAAVPIRRYAILVREERTDLKVETITTQTAAALSVPVMEAEYSAFLRHLLWHEFNRTAGGRPPLTTAAEILARWRALLPEALASAECLLVRIPRSFAHDELLRLAPMLRDTP